MKKVARVFGIVLIVLIVLVVAVRLILPYAVVKIANDKLPGILRTEASIGDLNLSLLRGSVSLRDLRIAQPEGFGDGDLLLVPAVSVKIKLSSLFSPPLTVEEVCLTDWEVNLVKNRDGVMNLEAIMPESSPPSGEVPEPEGEEEGTAASPILVRVFAIENLSFSYADHAIARGEETAAEGGESDAPAEVSPRPPAPAGEEVTEGDPESAGAVGEEEVLRVRIVAFDLKVHDLLIDPTADPAAVEPAPALLTARIIQEPFSDGLLGLAARIGPVGTGLPPLNAVLRLGDLELKPLALVVPAGVTQTLGGSALDLRVDLALADYLIDCELEVEASGGHVIPLTIGGTPDEPEVDKSSILFGALLHLGGGVGNLVGNVGGAGYQLAAGATETTYAVGKGAVNVVGSIGGGLFKTVTSAATGDLDGAVEGLSDTTVGTAKTAAAAGADVAGEIAEGATATADSTIGADADRQWRADTRRRWEESWSTARKLLDEMEYPPPPREAEPVSPGSGENPPESFPPGPDPAPEE